MLGHQTRKSNMNRPHESQAAAMARTGELPDGEQLRECINSGQVSAAQVVAHQQAGEAAEAAMSMFVNRNDYEQYLTDRLVASNAARAEAMQEAARWKADVERLREALKHIHFAAMDITVDRSTLSFVAGDAIAAKAKP